jgi:hypothetical protein
MFGWRSFVKYVRLYSNEKGESHFEEVEVSLAPTDYAPPAPPINVSTPSPAHQLIFLAVPPGWKGDWHPSPARQFMIFTSGKLDIEASDGQVCSFAKGDVCLGEDLFGKGHRSQVVGDTDVSAVIVQMPIETAQA